jgi:hypothetical protein
MGDITAAFYDRMAGDATLAGYLAEYRGAPAVFTAGTAPEDATLPYIVTGGEVAVSPWDTKTTRGREIWRDLRVYADRDGSAVTVERIAERVRALFHRHRLTVGGFEVNVAEVGGPIAIDEAGAYGRLVTVRLIMEETA